MRYTHFKKAVPNWAASARRALRMWRRRWLPRWLLPCWWRWWLSGKSNRVTPDDTPPAERTASLSRSPTLTLPAAAHEAGNHKAIYRKSSVASDRNVELAFAAILVVMCCFSAVSAVLRIRIRRRGWPDPLLGEEQPMDAELLTVATWLGFLNLLYYVRCTHRKGVGRLAVTLVKMAIDDVFKLFLLCARPPPPPSASACLPNARPSVVLLWSPRSGARNYGNVTTHPSPPRRFHCACRLHNRFSRGPLRRPQLLHQRGA